MKVQATKSITTKDGVIHRELVVVVFPDRFTGEFDDDDKEAALAEKRAARLLRALAEPRVPIEVSALPVHQSQFTDHVPVPVV